MISPMYLKTSLVSLVGYIGRRYGLIKRNGVPNRSISGGTDLQTVIAISNIYMHAVLV